LYSRIRADLFVIRLKAKDLDELKKKVGAPSLQPKGSARSHAVERHATVNSANNEPAPSLAAKTGKTEQTAKNAKSEQAAADRSGIKVRLTCIDWHMAIL
jgi:hypothetical protein